MSDQLLLIKALEEAQGILSTYGSTGRNPHSTVKDLINVLQRSDLTAAIRRLKEGYGLRVVK